MHYYLYEIKNNINGKIYIGIHKTNNLNDGYMGSGKILNRAFKLYGVEHFTKRILETFNSANEMRAREKEVVNDEFLARNDTYNIMRGGNGGFDYINKTINLADRNRKISANRDYKNPNYLEKLGKSISEGKQDKNNPNNFPSFKGKTHSADTLLKMSSAQKERVKTTPNSQLGTMWITNGTVNSKIKKTNDIPFGWRKGRVGNK